MTAARALGGALSTLSAALFAEPNPTVIKAVLHAQGRIPTPAVRMPLLPARPGSAAAARRHLGTLEAAAAGGETSGGRGRPRLNSAARTCRPRRQDLPPAARHLRPSRPTTPTTPTTPTPRR